MTEMQRDIIITYNRTLLRIGENNTESPRLGEDY